MIEVWIIKVAVYSGMCLARCTYTCTCTCRWYCTNNFEGMPSLGLECNATSKSFTGVTPKLNKLRLPLIVPGNISSCSLIRIKCTQDQYTQNQCPQDIDYYMHPPSSDF